jgi:hypothetical protein
MIGVDVGDGGAAVCQTKSKIAKSINKYEFLKQVSIKISNKELYIKICSIQTKMSRFYLLEQNEICITTKDLPSGKWATPKLPLSLTDKQEPY